MSRRGRGWRGVCGALVLGVVTLSAGEGWAQKVEKFVRFSHGGKSAYGIVEDARVRQLDGDLFAQWSKTDKTFALKDVKLLVPCEPRQVFALAGTYRSHLAKENTSTTTITTVTKVVSDADGKVTSESTTTTDTRKGNEVPVLFQTPQVFFKSVSSLIAADENIVYPRDAKVVHYEAELVIVIRKTARKVSKESALDYVLGVTCGNDVSERVWQKGDVQWWRAKGSDTFGPVGPYIVSGLNYDDLLVQMRVNGETKQKERTSQLIHSVPAMVSSISQYVTLLPGDLIFTGTSGTTTAIKPGDLCEVEIEGVGVLKNPVVAE